jgi:hypothetical protein
MKTLHPHDRIVVNGCIVAAVLLSLLLMALP